MDVARRLVAEHYKTDKDVLMLRHWRGGWWEWQGPKWQEVEQRAVRATAYRFTETAMYMGTDGLSRWEPNRNKIGERARRAGGDRPAARERVDAVLAR